MTIGQKAEKADISLLEIIETSMRFYFKIASKCFSFWSNGFNFSYYIRNDIIRVKENTLGRRIERLAALLRID